MLNKLKKQMAWESRTPAQNIALSFVILILSGTFLLMLPISNNYGEVLPFIDALFTSTSASCVTGLAVVNTLDYFSVFGQIVILFLIQIGGLGVMTIMATFILFIRNKLSLNEKIAMKEMLNREGFTDMKAFIVDILKYTFFFEAVGLILLAITFIPEYGLVSGLYKSIFISISAFCNAGFDIIGPSSLVPFQNDYIVNFVVMGLIILGGLGFAVWFDLRDRIKDKFNNKRKRKGFFKALSTHSKIVLYMTVMLIIIPAILILLIEWNNPDTIGQLNFFDKVVTALFSSVTLRTAGFATIDMGLLYPATQLLMIPLMFIGGSPGGTAGGIKTTTFAIMLILFRSLLKNEKVTSTMNRAISNGIIYRAVVIITLNVFVLFIGTFALTLTQDFSFMEIFFEAASSLGTVGLSLGITASISTVGKYIIVCLMYLGRIGALTVIVTMMRSRNTSQINYPEANIIVG